MQQAPGGASNGRPAGALNDDSADPGSRRPGHVPDDHPAGAPDEERPVHPVWAFFRANPQVLVLLIICVVLGLGTFFAVIFGLIAAGSDQTTGEPSGAIFGAHAALAAVRTAAWI
jgi:hypothetical protein